MDRIDHCPAVALEGGRVRIDVGDGSPVVVITRREARQLAALLRDIISRPEAGKERDE